MRAIRFHEHGGADVLQLDDDVAEPTPNAHEVLVRVRAASVNPVDTYFREGSYTPASLPWIPGVDFAGEVAGVGDAVDRFTEGDRVFGTGLGNDHPGTYAEYTTSPEDRITHLPDGVDYQAGAAIGVAGVTSWRALVDHAGLEPAETVLVHGGSGGVGHAAVQLGAATGARVLTTANPDYVDTLESMGAAAVFDYDRDDLADAVVDAGSPDVVLDHRLDDYLDFDATVAHTGTRVVGIGNTVPEAGWENVPAARAKDIQLTLMSMFNTPRMADQLSKLAYLMAEGDLAPHVARSYDLADAAQAQHDVMHDSFLGKLVIDV
jgi:NADPH2:quinone reductase